VRSRFAIVLALLLTMAALAGVAAAAPQPASTPPVAKLRVIAHIPVGEQGGGIVWAKGFIWLVGVYPHSEVAKIDPATNRIVGRLRLGGAVDDAWIGYGEGSLWVSRSSANEVDRVSLSPLALVHRIKLEDPFDVAVGFGSVWVPQFNPYRWSRIDARANAVTMTQPATGPTSAVVDGGNVWILAHRSQSLLEINSAGGTVTRSIPVKTGGSVPERIAAGFGSIWATDPQSSSVARIDEVTGKQLVEIVLPLPRLFNPYGIATGGSSVWVATDHGLGRISPVTNRLTAMLTFPFDNKACGPKTQWPCTQGVAYANGSVWVTDWNTRQVLRVAPN
jgi:hypothetical protein